MYLHSAATLTHFSSENTARQHGHFGCCELVAAACTPIHCRKHPPQNRCPHCVRTGSHARAVHIAHVYAAADAAAADDADVIHHHLHTRALKE